MKELLDEFSTKLSERGIISKQILFTLQSFFPSLDENGECSISMKNLTDHRTKVSMEKCIWATPVTEQVIVRHIKKLEDLLPEYFSVIRCRKAYRNVNRYIFDLKNIEEDFG